MTTTTINTKQIRDALRHMRDVVDEIGSDYIDNNCLYVVDNAPSCIVGHVLHRMGFPLAELEEYNDDRVCIISPILIDMGINPHTINVLDEAQCLQDEGKTWGEALNTAIEYAKNTLQVTIE